MNPDARSARRTRLVLATAAALALGLLGLAFIAAPRSCAGGLELYAGAGAAVLAALALLPFAARVTPSLPGRAGWSIALTALGAGAWLAGLFAADVRIMCRLF